MGLTGHGSTCLAAEGTPVATRSIQVQSEEHYADLNVGGGIENVPYDSTDVMHVSRTVLRDHPLPDSAISRAGGVQFGAGKIVKC